MCAASGLAALNPLFKYNLDFYCYKIYIFIMVTKLISSNRKARFQYSITETFEAGIQLLGTEVKSLRTNSCSLNEGYVIEQNGEMFLKKINIPIFKQASINNHEPLRIRKLLLHKKEIEKIKRSLNEKGTTLIPLKIYFKGSLIKIELGIGKGKKLFDKRESIKEKDTKRDVERDMKNKY